MSKFAELTEEQDAALMAYAEWYGQGWRQQLETDWMNAGTRAPVEWSHLQRLRNTHGPRWLGSVGRE